MYGFREYRSVRLNWFASWWAACQNPIPSVSSSQAKTSPSFPVSRHWKIWYVLETASERGLALLENGLGPMKQPEPLCSRGTVAPMVATMSVRLFSSERDDFRIIVILFVFVCWARLGGLSGRATVGEDAVVSACLEFKKTGLSELGSSRRRGSKLVP